MQHYSDWIRLKRAVAWLLRLKSMLLKKGKSIGLPVLSTEELQHAETALIIHVQGSAFPSNLKESNVQKLSPTFNSDGLMCVGGRLSNAPIPDEAMHPILLPSTHPVSELIVRHYHLQAAHAGIERTLSDIRQRFWITKGRATVKRVLRQCIPCKKLREPTLTQFMADLPANRVTPNDPPSIKSALISLAPSQ